MTVKKKRKKKEKEEEEKENIMVEQNQIHAIAQAEYHTDSQFKIISQDFKVNLYFLLFKKIIKTKLGFWNANIHAAV